MHNWANLSDHDFEAVCRDMLGRDVGAAVESFASGKDGGIDLRCTHMGNLIIGQCKHYLRSTYPALLKSLGRELNAIRNLTPQPDRYIIYTSMSLSPRRKEEIKAALRPYVVQTSDVVGLEDLESRLRLYPEIEANHYKLWLASAQVLDHIIGNSVHTRSRIRVEGILGNAKLFVPHDKLPVAEQILLREHCLIISGPPGIGKTTMAEMLALRFLQAGYSASFVANVAELEQRLRPEEKQLFIYDDFLGRTNFRQAPEASSQERLFSLIRYISGKPDKYFVLTTREYLYREAYSASERLADSRAELMRCFLDVAGYTESARAEILYNHLYWAVGIPQRAIEQFVAENGHWGVIRHENFNPRWIADTLNRVAKPTTVQDCSPWI